MTGSSVDAVLPLRLADCDRFEILKRSLKRFFMDLGTCWVVTPDNEFEAIRSRIRDSEYSVVPQTSVVPELEHHKPISGWFVQQLLKMAVADRMSSDFYLALDADVICTRNVRSSDLIKGERALGMRYVGDTHRNWYEWASRVLGVPRSRWTHAVTPVLLNTQVVLALQGYLAQRDGSAPGPVSHFLPGNSSQRKPTSNWRTYLLRNLPWTEYALYFTFLEALGIYEEFYTHGPICSNSVWDKRAFASWRAEESFVGQRTFFFTVVQSNTGVSVPDVWDRVRGYLE